MQVNGEGLPTGTPPAGSGDPNPPANTGGQGDPAPTTPPTDPPPAAPPKDPEDLDGLKKSLEASRADQRSATARAREAQKQLDEANKRLKEIDDAQKSELEKVTERADAAEKRAAEADARARTVALRSEIVRFASRENFADPSDAYRFVDEAAVKFDEDGQPEGVEELVKELAKSKPYLLNTKTPTPNPPPRTPNGSRDARGTPDADEQERKRAVAQQIKQTF